MICGKSPRRWVLYFKEIINLEYSIWGSKLDCSRAKKKKADFYHMAYKWALQAISGPQVPTYSEQTEASPAKWILRTLWNFKEPVSHWQDRKINSCPTCPTRPPENHFRKTCFSRSHVHSSPIPKTYQSIAVPVWAPRRRAEPCLFNPWYSNPPHMSPIPKAPLWSPTLIHKEPSIHKSKPTLEKSLLPVKPGINMSLLSPACSISHKVHPL